MSTPSIARAPLVGGRLCLDFTNTAAGWTPRFELIDDRLNGLADLVAWSRYVQLIDQRQAAALLRAEPQQALERAKRLRLAIYRVCASRLGVGKTRAADVECINQELQILRSSERLVVAKNGFSWAHSLSGADEILGQIAQSAADLLIGDGLQRLRMCPGESCGWLFEDTSRNHSRQWCDMKMCGNLAKVRRFRERSA